MKKVLAFLLCMCMVTTLFVSSPVYAVEADLYEDECLIQCQISSYKDNNGYTGTKITNPHIDVASFARLDILADGGTHIDGDGNLVFSNYVAFSVFLNFDKDSKYIAESDVKVSKDSCDWNDMNDKNGHKYGDPETDTEKQISYGAVVATRTDGNGSIFKYTPVFSTGNTSFEQQLFNEDGNYTIYVFFETEKDGKYQNHILSWSFKIRTSIYLRDKTSGLHIKNSGLSGNDVIIDSASRQGVLVQVYKDGVRLMDYDENLLSNNPILTDSGSYKFVVTNNGFICEVFHFIIDKENIDKKVFFSNLRRQLGSNSYEAEGYFSFEWSETISNPIQYATYSFCDGVGKDIMDESEQKFSDPVLYTPQTKLDQIGIYMIYAFDGKQSVTYFVNVVDMDDPSKNYEKLSSERFNTFKTKWWQVYDESTGRYLCFDYDTEYDRAYNAAMTIANNSVIDGTGRYFFKGTWYNDRIDLTAAMNDYVFNHNLCVFYYDPADYSDNVESERTFSLKAFDNTIYLNDEFQFVSAHPSEVASVVITDSNGKENAIDFSVPISEQENALADGEYIVKESDKYGNEITYTAYRDKSAPEVILSSNKGDIMASNGDNYTVSYFSISSLFDKYDEYAVLKIVSTAGVQYYYKSEYKGVVFDNSGEYHISAYDRNGNVIEFTIAIS